MLQFNAQKKSTANAQVNDWMSTRKNSVALLQEPNQKRGRITFINSEVIQYTGGADRPRACILVSKSINDRVIKVNQFCTEDQVVISMKYGNSRLLIASTYMAHDALILPDRATQELVQYSIDNCYELIMLEGKNY